MATAAVHSSVPSTSNKNVSDEERRWVVIGICLQKIFTPALRRVLSNEMPIWHQTLVKPPQEITKQTPGKYAKSLPPSTIKLNYDSINNNTVHKSPKSYDYAVKDPLSLAKLFLKPFMASFTGFDHTMDTSAALSVMCEAQPFFTSGAAALAKKVRSDIRNEWAHCDFSHWTEPNFQTAVQDMESLVKKAGLTLVEEKLVLADLGVWKKNGQEICLGSPVDPVLLRMVQIEVAQLMESFKTSNDDAHNMERVLEQLASINSALKGEVDQLKKTQAATELKVQELFASQSDLLERYSSNSREIEALRSQFFSSCEKEDVYVFNAPDTFSWFTGRQNQIREIEVILKKDEKLNHSSARKAAICGLGGCGKTSLVVEYAHRMRSHYEGGVFFFSGEDEKKLENSVNDLALSIGTFISNSFDVTLSQTLARISRIQKPWLLIIDDMDELRLSPKVRKVLSGSWQKNSNGHIIVTTRRKQSVLIGDVPEFKENPCLELQCFDFDDSKEFLFNRTGITRSEDAETAAYNLFEELGGLPLALEQAAAYIKSLECSFLSYLESYKAKRLALLNQQPSNPVSEYSSPERLAVQTTWRLNIDYIKQNSEGRNAIRFLNACVFFNPNEIQKELINVGEPPVKDEQFQIFLGNSLGRHQIFKLLTDFSLFKQTSSRCLQVHRLVLDVIKENLTPREKEESFVDAVRMLQHGFSKCVSPDALLSSVADRARNVVDYTNSSLFYLWKTFCLHAGEIQKNLNNFLLDRSNITEQTVFAPEMSRIVYQYALYLSVFHRNGEAMQAMNFAVKILDWVSEAESVLLPAKINSLFPHAFPLPEFIRRHIQYCSKAPALSLPNVEEYVNSFIDRVEAGEYEKLRQEGNKLFHDGCFQEAVEAYSSAIDREEKRKLLDPRFFSNRASAYIKLELYDKALEDAKVYISQRPECWKGYARKALALLGLNDKLGAELAACQTYYLFREVFSKYDPFRRFSYLQERVTFCHSDSDFLLALNTPCMLLSKKVIFLSSGTYNIMENVSFNNCIVLGCVDQPRDSRRLRVNFMGSSCSFVITTCALANLDFLFDMGSFVCVLPTSMVILSNCCFTSRNPENPSFQATGATKVENCDFRNCGAGGFLCVVGTSVVENCTFSNNRQAGLEVCKGGTLLAKNVCSYNNRKGLLIGPKAKRCLLTNSQINCNSEEGIFVSEQQDGGIELSKNSIFHNDHFGISLRNASAVIGENRIFENNLWGIWLQSNSCCRIVRNDVAGNTLGGIRVGKRPREWVPSVVEFNMIHDNGGPGLTQSLNEFDVNAFVGKQIFPVEYVNPFTCNISAIPPELEDTLVPAKCRENVQQRNEEESVRQTQPGVSPQVDKFCSYCREKGTDLRKCTKCYTAEYCGRACQKKHWKRHKTMCHNLLKRCSVLLTSAEPFCKSRSKSNNVSINYHHYGLEEVGPKYCGRPPKNGNRFVVKVQFARPPFSFTFESISLVIYDRSLEIYEKFQSDHIQSLIRELGFICQKQYIEKKLFMWAAYTENNVIRLFTNEFPPYQRW